MLADELAPVARSDDQPGLCWLAEGDDLYRQLIRLHTGLDLTPQELHQIGMAEVTESLPAQYRAIGLRAFGTDDLGEIFAHLLGDADLRYTSGDEIVADAKRCLDDATAAMGQWFGIVPEAPCVLTPIPDFLAADAPAAYYTPPAPDGSRPGEYHVNLHDPTSRGRAETASIAFHEAIPGHHLQLAIASERTDLPAFRRLSWGHTAFVEGWALYTERLADEMGLYEQRPRPARHVGQRLVASVSPGGRHRPPRHGLDPPAGHRLHGGARSREPRRDRDRDRPLHRHARPGLGLQGGPARDPAPAGRGRGPPGRSAFTLPGFHDVVLGAATVSLAVLAERVAAWTGS